VSKEGQNGGRLVHATRRGSTIVIEVQPEGLPSSHRQIIHGKNRQTSTTSQNIASPRRKQSIWSYLTAVVHLKDSKLKGLAAFFGRKKASASSAATEHAEPPAEETGGIFLQEFLGEENVATEECKGFSAKDIGHVGFPTSHLRDFPTELNIAMKPRGHGP